MSTLAIIGLVLYILGIVLLMVGALSKKAIIFIIGGLLFCTGIILVVLGSEEKELTKTSKNIPISIEVPSYIEKRVVLDHNQDTVSITYIYKNEDI